MSAAERGFHKSLSTLRQLQKNRGFVPHFSANNNAPKKPKTKPKTAASAEVGFVPQPDSPQNACVLPAPEVMINRAPHGKLPWQKPPLAACSQQIEDRIQYCTNIRRARSATGQRSRKKGRDKFPG